ncbi:MAG: hypothetical protein K2M96_03980 [Prevotella sp.]|nr:hypothetical protein [Prevotella sp.]
MGVVWSRAARIVCQQASHHVPTRSAPCTEAVRIMSRCAPHRVPRPSAPCAEGLRIVCAAGTYCRTCPLSYLRSSSAINLCISSFSA